MGHFLTTNPRTTVILSCKLSYPAQKVDFYKWDSFGKLMKLDIDGTKYQSRFGQELLILRTSLRDQGRYECKTDGLDNKVFNLFVNAGEF